MRALETHARPQLHAKRLRSLPRSQRHAKTTANASPRVPEAKKSKRAPSGSRTHDLRLSNHILTRRPTLYH